LRSGNRIGELGVDNPARTSIATIIACALALGILLATALILAPIARAQGNQQMVSIRDFFFSPARISVPPGTKVTWVNQGTTAHTVTADDGSFDSGTLPPGQSFSHTFRSRGTVPYHCELHPVMRGSVTVGSGRGATTGGAAEAKAGGTQAKAGSGLL
jgi:plastocyanin